MAIANTIPGFSGLTSDASNLIKQLMSGNLSGSSKRAIFDAGAERGTAAGMPGSTGMAGSLFANADLRDIGRTSEDNQQRGFQDLLAMITGYSGTVTPTAGQELQDQANRRALGFQQYQYQNDWNRAQQEKQRLEREAKFNQGRKMMNFRNFARSQQSAGGLFGPSDNYLGDYDFPEGVKIRPGIKGIS